MFFPRVWESSVEKLLANLLEEIPLEFSIALGLHTVCTAYASNSFYFTVYDTPEQGQMQVWAS